MNDARVNTAKNENKHRHSWLPDVLKKLAYLFYQTDTIIVAVDNSVVPRFILSCRTAVQSKRMDLSRIMIKSRWIDIETTTQRLMQKTRQFTR